MCRVSCPCDNTCHRVQVLLCARSCSERCTHRTLTAPERDTPSLAHVSGVKTEAQNSVVTCQGDVYVAGLDPGGSCGGRPWPGLVIRLFDS